MDDQIGTPLPPLHVVCRPARQSDTADVLELTRTIWDGHDYVPEAWEGWLADPQGLLAVAEYQRRVLGLGKLTRLSSDDWWLEGLRVHPEYQGRWVGSQLNDYLLAHWLQTGNGALRLATNSERVQVHHMCQRNGFTKAAEFTWYVAPNLDDWSQNSGAKGPIQASSQDAASSVDLPKYIKTEDESHASNLAIPDRIFRSLGLQEISKAVSFARQSPSLQLSNGLMGLFWRWAPPKDVFFVPEVERQRVWWWRDEQGLLISGDDVDDEGNPTAIVKLLACSMEAIPDILGDFRRLAALLGFPKAGWLAPLHPELLPLLETASFQRDWENSLFLFEKWHD
jgi:GNAT superfamily N-acetyltransferase